MVLCYTGSLPFFREAFCEMQDAQYQGTTPSDCKDTQPTLLPSPPAEIPPPAQVAKTPETVVPTEPPLAPASEGEQVPAAGLSEVPAPALSKSAIDKRLRRVFEPRVDGTFLVDEKFLKQYANKGADREKLCQLFEKCNYDPDILAEIMFECLMFQKYL